MRTLVPRFVTLRSIVSDARIAALLACALLGASPTAAQTPAGTAFTYQGQLVQAGTAVTGSADFIFRLYDAPSAGTMIGSAVSVYAVAVEGGVFNAILDFGVSAFNGDARYLEIQVRTPATAPASGAAYTTLLPRQTMTPVPYAITALNSIGGGSSGWQLTGNAITNTNGGFVGINGATPITPAEVFGVRSPALSGYGGMYMATAGTDGLPFYGFSAGGSVAWTYLHGPTGSWRLFNGADRLTVLNNGNVGVGTLTPQYRLDVAGPVRSSSGGFVFPDGTVQTTAGGGGGGGSNWIVVNNDLYNTNSDQVMIGTSTPATGAKLTVGGGPIGSTVANFNGSLLSKIELRGGPATLDIFAGVDESRLITGTAQDLSLIAGGKLFYRSIAEQQFYTNGNRWARIDAAGLTEFFHSNNNPTVAIDGQDPVNGGGLIELRKADGTRTLELFGAGGSGTQGSALQLYNDTNPTTPTVVLDGEYGGAAGGALVLRNSNGAQTIELAADLNPGERGMIRMYKPSGTRTIEIDTEESGDPTQGGTIKLYDDAGNLTIELDADHGTSNEGRIITQVIEITGGSDLSEQFDIAHHEGSSIEPGSVVSIDPFAAGDLRLSTGAYDRRVAGIVSGAGGVRPGMLMGQRGSAADGQHPVALTGRVYCKVDASYGAIEPGDLLTTSDTAGHAMRVLDPTRASGAILGKAMTALESGRGLVLVLVTLQ